MLCKIAYFCNQLVTYLLGLQISFLVIIHKFLQQLVNLLNERYKKFTVIAEKSQEILCHLHKGKLDKTLIFQRPLDYASCFKGHVKSNIQLITFTRYMQIFFGNLTFTAKVKDSISGILYPLDTGRKLNVHKTFRKRPRLLLKVLCTFNVRPVFKG